MLNKWDLLRFAFFVCGMAVIFNTIGWTCGTEQQVIDISQL